MKDDDISRFLNELYELHGYDFSNYAKASLRRRVDRLMVLDRMQNLDDMLQRLREDPDYLSHLVEEITVNVTEMFRDPHAFKYLRENVIPDLASRPFIRIWHAGCASGEEVYSTAIMLEELGLLQKSLIYATDLNPSVVDNIRKGIFPLSQMKQYSENYIQAGGEEDFSSYYTAQYGLAKFDERFKDKMIAATHNLVSDRSFNEFQLIICRNVLIYFDKDLQDRVLSLFDESLEPLGYLMLGSKENLRFSNVYNKFQMMDGEKIWRKTR